MTELVIGSTLFLTLPKEEITEPRESIKINWSSCFVCTQVHKPIYIGVEAGLPNVVSAKHVIDNELDRIIFSRWHLF